MRSRRGRSGVENCFAFRGSPEGPRGQRLPPPLPLPFGKPNPWLEMPIVPLSFSARSELNFLRFSRRAGASMEWNLLAVDRGPFFRFWLSGVRSVRQHCPGLNFISKVCGQNFVAEMPDHIWFPNWHEDFHSMVEVPRHQIGAADIDLLVPVIVKVVHTAVFE